jgi:hypothetical protein
MPNCIVKEQVPRVESGTGKQDALLSVPIGEYEHIV